MKRREWSGGRDDGNHRDYKRQRESATRDQRRPDLLAQPHAGSGERNAHNERAPPAQVKLLSTERETDAHRLSQRQKQIDYGKNTLGYDRYCEKVPKHARKRGVHPMTPDKTLKVSKKAFDGMIRKWRQALHRYDPPELTAAQPTSVDPSQGEAPTASATASVDKKREPANGTASSNSSVLPQSTATIPDRAELTNATEESTQVPALSIYEDFVEAGDGDSEDDLL
ncbi:TPA: hypothetical protein N0F65_012799 [Lagenidium giganteum]|uniref:Histone RNA hairpin-binding protein RNA-binding domain-containing protein n=1 Tax=Lagenidium giganteum TaxID=4803 RepID=A0AAV2YHP5_9STRA|nr:TPA: hypothetical protein N0F65_012799 [Lagenidium giganteum]